MSYGNGMGGLLGVRECSKHLWLMVMRYGDDLGLEGIEAICGRW